MSQRSLFLWTCWIPAAVWVVTLRSLRQYDGWGAWAAAPLLLPSLFLSILGVAWGMCLLIAGGRDGRFDTAVALGTCGGAVVVGFYVVRYLLR